MEWISVNDKLPPLFESVLVINNSFGKQKVQCGFMDEGFGMRLWKIPSSILYTQEDITHWAPLPEPPGVKENHSLS